MTWHNLVENALIVTLHLEKNSTILTISQQVLTIFLKKLFPTYHILEKRITNLPLPYSVPWKVTIFVPDFDRIELDLGNISTSTQPSP